MIDLRSDTVTQPSVAMRDAMQKAVVGDDVYGEDPTVNSLQEFAADLMGKEAALFLCSASQANLVALMSHCQYRGDEYVVGQEAHCYRWEGGGASVLGGIQPQPIEFEKDATLDLEKVIACIKPDDVHHPVTRLLCLENTHKGVALPMDYLPKVAACSDQHGLLTHLDGARLFNAAVFHGVAPVEMAKYFDSVTLCLSKGLGAPVGAILCGSKAFIKRAHRFRKLVGGGMRQVGVVASAGRLSLENYEEKLTLDHENARRLAEGLATLPGIEVSWHSNQTNMVFIEHQSGEPVGLVERMRRRGVILPKGAKKRLVTHCDVASVDIDKVVDAYRQEL